MLPDYERAITIAAAIADATNRVHPYIRLVRGVDEKMVSTKATAPVPSNRDHKKEYTHMCERLVDNPRYAGLKEYFYATH